MKYDVIIIGAGASGLFCAIEAGKRGRSVLVLDHAAKIGSKIRVSGGGRCNFGNTGTSADNYISQNPHFCRSALAVFSSGDFISMLGRYGIRFSEREHGRLFCEGNAIEIVHMLKNEADAAGVEIRLQTTIHEIKKNDVFEITTGDRLYSSNSLVIATGGRSYPSLGASGLGYEIAGQFGINVNPQKAGLVPFIFNGADRKIFSGLSGISIDAEVRCGKRRFRETILFTHKGLSGPGILQISSYWKPGASVIIDLLPDLDVLELFMEQHQSRVELHNLLSGFFPKRFAQTWCELFALSKPLNQYPLKELKRIAHQLHNWEILPEATEGYDRAEVTVGGVDPDELSSKTMESKKIRGLYFIGEVVDVTGQLGGYNLQWAWSSGFAAGRHV